MSEKHIAKMQPKLMSPCMIAESVPTHKKTIVKLKSLQSKDLPACFCDPRFAAWTVLTHTYCAFISYKGCIIAVVLVARSRLGMMAHKTESAPTLSNVWRDMISIFAVRFYHQESIWLQSREVEDGEASPGVRHRAGSKEVARCSCR